MEPLRLLDSDEAAEVLNTSPRHVRALTERGELPVVKVGRLNRYLPDDLLTFAKSNRRGGDAG